MLLLIEALTHISSSLSKQRHKECVELMEATDVYLRCQKPTEDLCVYNLVIIYFTVSNCN